MSDPDRWRPPDGSEDDAIFADIVAHLNDDEIDDEGAARTATGEGAAGDAAADVETVEEAAETSSEPAPGRTPEPADLPPEDGPSGDPAHWPVNQPPGLPVLGSPQAVPAPQVWRAHEVDDEYEEHFEPPPVTPLPAGDLQFWAIIAGMGGGPLLLVYLVFFNRYASSYWILTAIAMSVGGFALLVSRMPGHHEDEDKDDGARL